MRPRRRSNNHRLIVIAGLPALAACGWWMAGRPDDAGGPMLDFDHALHAGEFEMACAECHGDVGAAENLEASFSPSPEVCMDCHDPEEEFLQQNPERFTAAIHVPPAIRFSHAAHMPRVEDDCARCHDAITATALPLPEPGHPECFGCHEHQEAYDAARCMDCHTSMQELPLAEVAEFDHQGDWLSRHGQMAHAGGQACMSCHGQTDCDDCHSTIPPTHPARLYPDRLGEALIHRGDFITQHAIDARADADMCLRCHQDTGFCEDCHTANGLTARAASPLQPHPTGWMDPSSADFHGPPARVQTASCAACHDQGASSNCVECHAVGRVGGNPHPSGWSDRFELSEVSDNAVCQYCHTNGL